MTRETHAMEIVIQTSLLRYLTTLLDLQNYNAARSSMRNIFVMQNKSYFNMSHKKFRKIRTKLA